MAAVSELEAQPEGRQGAVGASGPAHSLKELQAKNAKYHVRSNRNFFDVEPMAAEIEELKAEN
eukprot:6187050-Pleurochrysis_carterae.AAC.2